jgi:hypothetical protein
MNVQLPEAIADAEAAGPRVRSTQPSMVRDDLYAISRFEDDGGAPSHGQDTVEDSVSVPPES